MPGSLFIGTYSGVFFLENNSTEWKKYGCLPNTSVNDIEIQYMNEEKIFIGTHGRGIFEAPLSFSLGVSEFDSNSLDIYPNPTKGTLTIKGNIDNAKVSIIDIRGRVINSSIKSENNSTIDMDLSQVAKGVYLLIIENKTSRFVKKIIKD